MIKFQIINPGTALKLTSKYAWKLVGLVYIPNWIAAIGMLAIMARFGIKIFQISKYLNLKLPLNGLLTI